MATTDKKRREYVEVFYTSGLTPVKFYSKHKLKPKTFYVWLKHYANNFHDVKNAQALGQPSKPSGLEPPLIPQLA